MATLSTSDGQFASTFTVNQQSGSYILLSTANKYVDKDIKITTNVKSAVAAANTASADANVYTTNGSNAGVNIGKITSVVGTKATTEPTSGYYIAINASGSGSSKITTAGWIGTGALTAATTNNNIKYFPIRTAKATVTASGELTAPTAAAATTAVSGKTRIAITPQTSNSFDTAYYTVLTLTESDKTITLSKSGLTQGFLGNLSDITANNLSLSGKTSTYYLPIPEATVTNAATGAATISSLNYSYDSTNNNFGISGSASISGTATATVSSAGWLASDVTGSTTGTASVSATVEKIKIKAAMSGTAKVTPAISVTTTTATGATNVIASGATASTSAPTNGYFISVKSAAKANTITATPSVVTAGYGDTTNYDKEANATLSVGANASAVTYVPIRAGEAEGNTATADASIYTTDGSNAGTNISAVMGTKATTEPTSGYYVAVSLSASGSSKVKTAGWFSTGALTAGSASGIVKYFPITAAEYSVTGGGLTKGDGNSSLASNGYYNGSSYDTNDKVALATTAASGYYKLTASGSGKVNRAAITKQNTKAGYLPTSSAATVSAATDLTSNTKNTEYFIKKSTLSASSVTSSASDQTITVYAGYYPTDRTITINKMTTVTPTTSYANTGMSTYFTAGTSSDKNVTITPRYSNSAGYVAVHTNTNNGGVGYWKIITTSISQGTTSVSGTTATRGTATWNTGWITQGSIPAASFANTASSGVTYVDITDTTAAPVIDTTDGYLYINKGYTDNLKIHIGKFISSDVTISATDQILASFTAYDANGNLLTGKIPSKSPSDITQNGNILTIPWGKYEGTVGQNDATTYTISMGDYSATASQVTAGAVTPSVSINNASTYGFTTTKPSGTNGTNYLTLDPGGTVATKWKARATATITTAGYIGTGSKTNDYEGSPTINAGTNYYVPVVSPSFAGGVVSGSTTTAITVTGMTTTTTATSYYIDAAATGTANRTAFTYQNAAGVIAAHAAGTQASAAPTAVNVGSSASRVYIPAATLSFSGGALSGKAASATFASNVITTASTDEYNNGLSVLAKGTAGRAAVTYTNTAGYMPAHTSAQGASGAVAESTWNGSTYYLKGVKLVAPSTGVSAFDITVPNGSTSGFITFHFEVDVNGNVTVMGPD